MKRTVTVILLVLCLVLSGCAGKEPAAEQETLPTAETTAPGTAAATEPVTETAPETTEPETEAETASGPTPDADGLYLWKAGFTEIKTRTNIRDYLADGCWDLKAMMADFGFERIDAKTFMLKQGDITLRVVAEGPDPLDFILWSWYTETKETIVRYVVFDNGPTSGEYFTVGSGTNRASLDVIAAFAYCVEHSMAGPATDHAAGLFPAHGDVYWLS